MSMQPGPEVDRLVVEKVFGWRVEHANAAGVCVHGRYEEMSPSTNIAHAWEVVEHMATKGMALTINGGNAGFLCFFYHRGEVLDGGVMTFPLVTDGHAEAATAPLAICRAALKASGFNA